MITERVLIVGIVTLGLVLVCAIGTIGDIIKKGRKDHERENDDNVSL